MEKSEDATPTNDVASRYSWYALSVLILVYMFNFIDRQILSILANDIMRDLNLTRADMGFLYGTAFGVFYAVFGIPLGRLADNWVRTRLMAVGLSLWSGATALSGFANSGTQLAVARVGVGIGEASASPCAYSLLSDWFPKRQRATALALYSSGLYIGGGISLLIGSQVVGRWNAAYPDGGPMGLVGWQAAFLTVGLPGLLLAIWVASLKEPLRGINDGMIQAKSARPFKAFTDELINVVPPFTLFGAARRGGNALAINVAGGVLIAVVAYALVHLTGNSSASKMQWGALGVGVYAVFSWVCALRQDDPPSFALIWKSPAFLATALGYGLVAMNAYAVSFWSAPYAESVFGASKDEVALLVGAPGALAGFLGVIMGGRMADHLLKKNPAGRIIVLIFGMTAPIIPFIICFTTDSKTVFYIAHFVCGILSPTALGASAAATQDLVLPRMRGIATATFFLGTTLVGISLGPYTAGQIATVTGSQSAGLLWLLAILPVTIGLGLFAYRNYGEAERTIKARAIAAGEQI